MYSQSIRGSGGLSDPDETSEKFVAIGIDFGTTYSGVCWARSTHPKELHEISGWPSEYHLNSTEVQVPTQYDINTGKWGYEVTSDMKPMKWFKLLLLNKEDMGREEISNSEQLKEARAQLSRCSNGLTPVQIVGSYLRALWNHTYATLKSMMDIDNLPLRVAITVPAIWPHYAQTAMRDAAKIAGILKFRDIGETTLILVQEPEAAALASLFQHNSFPDIQKGQSFVVCDAGGGTVDVISYTVTSERPFNLQECAEGDGKLAGAVRIDEAFKAHLRGKAKLKISSLSPAEYNSFIAKEWEQGAKRSFNNASEQTGFNLQPPSKAYGTMARLRNKETLQINRHEMKAFFQRSLTGIRSLVSEQCKQVEEATGSLPKKILLVGGLGSSEYVFGVLNEVFKNIVLRPSAGWSAVARGAVLRLLQENISSQNVLTRRQHIALATLPNVTSRKSRYHYGIEVDFYAADLDLEPEDHVRLNPEGVRVTTRMKWYLNKGDNVNKRAPVPFTYALLERHPLPPKCTFEIKYSASDTAPKRSDPTVLDLCRIECDWDKPIHKWKAVGNPADGWRKHEDLELTMGLEGEPKWEIRVGTKKKEHAFDVEYMR